MRPVMIAMILLGLAACRAQETPAGPEDGDACGADALQQLVGGPVAALDTDALDQPVRLIPPDTMVTMDHRPDRLNVDLDAQDRITRIWCG